MQITRKLNIMKTTFNQTTQKIWHDCQVNTVRFEKTNHDEGQPLVLLKRS